MNQNLEISDNYEKSLKLREYYILKATRDYIAFLEELRKDKYRFPVTMSICTYKEVKKMYYCELLEVNRLAELKLKKEILKFNLEKVS